MRFSFVKLNNEHANVLKKASNNINFTGDVIGKVNNFAVLNKVTTCGLDGLYGNLSKRVPDGFLKIDGDSVSFPLPTPVKDTFLFPITGLPKEILNSFANTFKIKKLQNSRILTEYNAQKEQRACERALRGLLQKGEDIIQVAADGTPLNKLKEDMCESKFCTSAFENFCEKAEDGFYAIFDQGFSKTKSNYHTPHERTIVRLISGGIAAVMLGNDFYNKSILNGKDKETATKEMKAKKGQELCATGLEAVSQYILLGAFSDFSNNSKWGAPILNTLLGIAFHITSRLMAHRPLIRVKAPNNIKYEAPSLESFKTQVKGNKKPTIEQNQEPEKKHLLTFKNIALACLGSIAVGFAGRGIKSTSLFQNFKTSFLDLAPVKAAVDKYKDFTIGKVWISEEDAADFTNMLTQCGKSKMSRHYNNIFGKLFENGEVKEFRMPDGTTVQKVCLGEYEKMLDLSFGKKKVLVSAKEFLSIPLMPIKIVMELASYPYKAASKILEGTGIIKSVEAKVKIAVDAAAERAAKEGKSKEEIAEISYQVKKATLEKLGIHNYENRYNIINTFLDFREQSVKRKTMSNKDFIDFYSKRMDNAIISSLDYEKKSQVDNAAIGKMTQLLSTAGSIYFATTDDYNTTIKQTGDKSKARKDARLRGINKMIRIATQSIILNFNHVFKIPYAKNLLGVALVTAGVTALTDMVSRGLSCMPYKKMDKEELEEYKKTAAEGKFRSKYYSMINKLTE